MEERHEKMIPIPIAELINGTTVPVNLYVRLGEDKFVCLVKAGAKTDRERFAQYENKTLDYLWVKRDQYGEFIHTNLTIAGVVVQQHNLDTRQKTRVVSNAAASVFRQLDHIGIGFESYSHAKQIMEATVSLAETHRDLSELLESLNDCSDQLLRHSMAVSCMSVLIAQMMKWDSRVTVEKLALGGLLHDIGKKALPPDLLVKPKAKMTFEEVQLYETHAFKGMQMLVGLGVVPDDVISIVYEHHENALGQGYPRKLRNMKIHPLARVVALANEFVNLTIANPNTLTPKNPREALLLIELTMGQPFNKDCFRALQMLIEKDHAKKAG